MTEQQMPFERIVAGWFADAGSDAAATAPDAALDRILETTRTTRPRPRVWAVLAEPTMRLGVRRAAVGVPNRRLILVLAAALLLAALAAAAVGAGLLLNRHPTDTAADWPGFRGAADHAGIGTQGPVGRPKLAWQFHAGGEVLDVAVAGDRVFFVAGDGHLYAVDRERGFLVWSVAVGDAPLTGPYAADGQLYVIDAAGHVRAFDQRDGRSAWTSTALDPGASRLIKAGGTLYFGTQNAAVVALDGATGAERWRLLIPGATAVNTPAFADGLVYAGTVGGGYVAIDATSHRIVWTADTGTDVTGTAGVADGIAFIGSGTEATSGTLRAFDARTGQPRWTAADPLLQFPAVADGVAYTSTSFGRVEAIDTSSGATKWRIQLTGEVRAPVVSGGIVYLFAGNEHRVYAVDAATGGMLWHFDVDGYGRCCIAVARGAVYVGLDDGSVYAIGGDGTSVSPVPFESTAPTPSAPATATASESAPPTRTALPTVATVDRTTDLRGRGFQPACQIAIDPTGRIWAPEAETGKIAIFGPDGTLGTEWSAPADSAGPFDFTRDNGDGYGTLAFAEDGSFYVLDVGNKRVQAFDASRRFLRAWGDFGDRPAEYIDPVGIAVAPDGTVWVLDDRRSVVEHYRPDGTVIGSFDPFAADPFNDGANSLAIDSHGNLYVSMFGPAAILVFDPTGKPLRTVGEGIFHEQAGDMAIDAAGRIFVTQGPDRGTAPGVLVFDADGALIGGFGPEGTGDGQLAFPGGLALDGKGGLYVEDTLPASARLLHVEIRPPAR